MKITMSSARTSNKPSSKQTKQDSSAGEPQSSLRSALLELHIKHELQQLEGSKFLELCEQEIQFIFTELQSAKLTDIVQATQINQVIFDNVVSAPIPGAIAEIAGEAADALFNSKSHRNTKLKQIISKKSYIEFIDKALELKEQRKQGIDKIIDLPIYADLISGILYQSIVRYIYDNNMLSKNIPGVSSILKMGRNAVNKAAPKLGSGLEESIRGYISDSLELILIESKAFLDESVSDDELKVSAIELWDVLEDKKLAEFQEGMSSLDLSEFIALGYDFWLSFRKGKYFKHSYETIVAYFFDKYGDQPLQVLMDDLEITPERALSYIQLFAPQALKTLKETGVLEALIRRHYETFYNSDELIGLLEKQR
jgi:hypothetical protein